MIAAGIIPPAERGYRLFYSAGVSCPCCCAKAWHVGRQSAECARCGAALPLMHPAVAVEVEHDHLGLGGAA